MNKTTVYLPDELRRSLRRLAAVSGRSEAELIREAIAVLTRASDQPRPRGRLFARDDPPPPGHSHKAPTGSRDR